MRKTLMFLVASTALTTAIGLQAWSAMHAPADARPLTAAATIEDGAQALPFIVASNKDDDNDRDSSKTSRRGHDDDDDDDCEDSTCRGGAGNPALAGTVAPPQYGLFGNGAPPKVKVN